MAASLPLFVQTRMLTVSKRYVILSNAYMYFFLHFLQSMQISHYIPLILLI